MTHDEIIEQNRGVIRDWYRLVREDLKIGEAHLYYNSSTKRVFISPQPFSGKEPIHLRSANSFNRVILEEMCWSLEDLEQLVVDKLLDRLIDLDLNAESESRNVD